MKLRTCRAYREACGRTLVAGAIPLAELSDSAAVATEKERSHGQPVVVNTLFVAQDAEPPAGLPCANVFRVNQPVLAKLAGVRSAAGALQPDALAHCNTAERNITRHDDHLCWLPEFPCVWAGIVAAAEVQLPEPSNLTRPGSVGRLLVLEGIQDPGNLVLCPVGCFADQGCSCAACGTCS